METITLVRSTAPRKDQRLVIYNIQGRTGSVQFLSTPSSAAARPIRATRPRR